MEAGQELEGLRQQLRELKDDEGWTACSSKPDFAMLHKHFAGTTKHGFKCRCRFVGDRIAHLVCLGREVDLMPTWNRFVTKADVLNTPHPMRLDAFAQLWFPWPFSPRNVVCSATLFDLFATDGCMLARLLPPAAELELPVADGVPLPLELGLVAVFPVVEDGKVVRFDAEAVAFVDPGIPVPDVILNFVIWTLAPWVFSRVLALVDKISSDPNHLFRSRIAAAPEVYGELERLVNDHCQRQRVEGAEGAEGAREDGQGVGKEE